MICITLLIYVDIVVSEYRYIFWQPKGAKDDILTNNGMS